MTDHRKSADFSGPIQELRRLAREPYESQRELQRLRRRISSERGRAHRNILERVAKQANVDLQPIFEEAQRRNAVKRRYVTRTLEGLQSKAAERAKAEKTYFHRIRKDYIRNVIKLDPTPPRLKFQQPIATSSSAQPGECNEVIGYGCSPPDLGSYEANADFGSPDPTGIWLFPFINTDNGDCQDIITATTLHDLTYQMAPPTTSFVVSSIRVDLIANGVATSHLGEPAGLFVEADPLYVHSFIDMTLWVAQLINGEWLQAPMLSDRLFAGNGDYVKQIRLVLSGQTYPAGIVILPAGAGGGAILCHLQVVCSASSIGSDGRNGIDFRGPDHGMFAGGVELLGDFA